MVGAGVFVVLAPAAEAAGWGLLAGLLIASGVAYANATASAQLATVYPGAGGTYLYGREVLGPIWGYLAGYGFVVGKTASLTAMALTLGEYTFPARGRLVAVAAVVVMTAVNYLGVEKTARFTGLIVGVVLIVLGLVIGAGFLAAGPFEMAAGAGFRGVLQSAGLLFFAFAGYARIATLGEEVIEPQRNIAKAILMSLALTLVVYALVATSALLALGPNELARSQAPLVRVVEVAGSGTLAPLVSIAAALAALGALLSLLAGVSRTVFAMSRNRELPASLAAVHQKFRTPHRAELAVGAAVVALTTLIDLRAAIGFSSFCVLTYYLIANVAAWKQPAAQRRYPRWLQLLGMLGCALLAFALPIGSVLTGLGTLVVGVLLWLLVVRWRRRPQPRA
jgi:APA family basic amino acid/polyamine antiporter